MALAVAPQYAFVNLHGPERVIGCQETAAEPWGQEMGIHSGRLDQVSYGRSAYPFWEQRTWQFVPEIREGEWGFRLLLDGLTQIEGVGRTPNATIEDFRERFHTEFQKLFVKRPFELDANETRCWNELRQVVDVESYRRNLPILTREFGRVESNQPGHWVVRWEAGERAPIDLSQFPDEFASYKPGQPFAAYLERDQETMEIRRVYSVARKPALKRQSVEDNAEFLDALQSNKDLPAASIQ